MKKENLLANAILKYEKNFDGGLIYRYKSDKEFLNDLTNELKENYNNKLIQYYSTYLVSANNTNLTNGKRQETRKLISLLEN